MQTWRIVYREVVRRDDTSAEQARSIIAKDDAERSRWSLHLYGLDPADSELYDLVLNIKSMTTEDAVELIVQSTRLQCFQITAESRRVLDDLELAARIQAVLIKDFPTVDVSSRDGTVFVSVEGALGQEEKQASRVGSVVRGIEGVRDLRVHFVPLVVAD